MTYYSALHYAAKAEKSAREAATYNYKNAITNCITEIPQDIKLELVDGVLTLKAGSKVYVPNGFEEDGVTPKFDEVVVASDITRSAFGTISGNWFTTLRLHDDGHFSLGVADKSNSVSGGSSVTPPTDGLWYDTDINKMRSYSVGAEVLTYATSLPFTISTFSSGTISSIDQVFNGFGYIGSTVFALPGVKGLIPDGRNADGSLKNIELVVDTVWTSTTSDSYTDYPLVIGVDSGFGPYVPKRCEYKEDINRNYNNDNNVFVNGLVFGYASSDGKITSFTPKQPFHAVDRNDSSWVAEQAMPSGKYIDLTLGASGSSYTAPANGWFFINRGSTSGNKYVEISNGIAAVASTTISGIANAAVLYPVRKGDVVTVKYTANTSGPAFRFIYAEGEN